MMRLKGNHVLLEPLPGKPATEGGIFFAERYRDDRMQFRVLVVGPGRLSKKKVRIPIELEVGDCVLTPQIHGNKFAYEDGSGWIIIEADEIIGKWQDEHSKQYREFAAALV